MATVVSTRLANAASRRILSASTTWLATSTLPAPLLTNTSASETLAAHTPPYGAAGGDLHAEDLRRLVVLAVGAQANRLVGIVRCDDADVVLEGIEVDQRDRRVEFLDRRADLQNAPLALTGQIASSTPSRTP